MKARNESSIDRRLLQDCVTENRAYYTIIDYIHMGYTIQTELITLYLQKQ